jgi:hypothetical protein
MLRAIGRVIRKHYKIHARESSIEPFAFNIMKDPWYVTLAFLFQQSICFVLSSTFMDSLS